MPTARDAEPPGAPRGRRPSPLNAARQAAEEAREAAHEATELVREARELLAETRALAAALASGKSRPADGAAPAWMSTGPEQLPRQIRMDLVKTALGWQFEGFWERPDDEQVTLYWAMRLLDQAREERLAQKVPGYRYVRAGFLDEAGDSRNTGNFGITVVAAPRFGPPAESYDDVEGRDLLAPVVVDGHRFPVQVVRPMETLHAPLNQPLRGSATCWARSRVSGARRGPALLTAKHVAADALEGQVRLSDGLTGQILDLAPDGIDAALISTSEVAGERAIPVQQLVAPWTDVEFVGSATGEHTTKVKAITDTRGILNAAALPCRMFLGDCGGPGDSGALVRNAATGEAVGLYMGSLSDPAGTVEGIAQHMYQVQLIMDLQLFE